MPRTFVRPIYQPGAGIIIIQVPNAALSPRASPKGLAIERQQLGSPGHVRLRAN